MQSSIRTAKGRGIIDQAGTQTGSGSFELRILLEEAICLADSRQTESWEERNLVRLFLKHRDQLNVIRVRKLVYQRNAREGIPPRQNRWHLPGERAWIARDIEDSLRAKSCGEGCNLASRTRPRRIHHDEIRAKIRRVAQGVFDRSFEELDIHDVVQPGIQLRLFDGDSTCLHSQDLTARV